MCFLCLIASSYDTHILLIPFAVESGTFVISLAGVNIDSLVPLHSLSAIRPNVKNGFKSVNHSRHVKLQFKNIHIYHSLQHIRLHAALPFILCMKCWSPLTSSKFVTHPLESLPHLTPLIQVRGTPGSYKTTLMELTHNCILSNDPEAIVEVIKVWPPKEPGTTI